MNLLSKEAMAGYAVAGGFATGVVMLGFGIMDEGLDEAVNWSREYQNKDASKVLLGEVRIDKKTGVRTAPWVNSKPYNGLLWSGITTINGVDIRGKDSFSVVNPPVVNGEGPDGLAPWIQLEADVLRAMGLQSQKVTVYINMSDWTWPHVSAKPEVSSAPRIAQATKTADGNYVTLDGAILPARASIDTSR